MNKENFYKELFSAVISIFALSLCFFSLYIFGVSEAINNKDFLIESLCKKEGYSSKTAYHHTPPKNKVYIGSNNARLVIECE